MKYQIFLLLSILSFVALGQEKFSGKVIDQSTNQPVEYVTIYNLNSKVHAHSDVLGRFTIETNFGDSIFVSMVGYNRMGFIVDEKTNWELSLASAPLELSQITVSPELNSLNRIKAVDLKLNPVNSSQEILRKVPGLFIAQHAGGGKAEQIFLRGFDIDHGTDIQITADGLPVNMVSHAHGQGYADLHFVIPETVQGVDFGKGPYYANKGNFTTAGYVDFKTFDRLDGSSIKVEGGSFNTIRTVGLIDLLSDKKNSNAYIATEYLASDGPFNSSQNFNRLNLFGKFTSRIGDDFLSLQMSTFTSSWDASGQIPIRAIESGQIDRFGAIDDTEGGETSRQNFLVSYTSTLAKNDFIETKAFISKYDFQLFSNFTFFLDDPINGDQIMQKESRTIYGVNSSHNMTRPFLSGELTLENGVGFRYDNIDGNELSHTKNRRQTLDTLALGDINEFNGSIFSNLTWETGKWLINTGVRVDQFRFQEVDALLPNYERRSTTKSIVSPKLNIVFSATEKIQFYAKSGKGFHSNDSRVVLANNVSNTLPSAFGYDVGTILRPFDRLIIDVAYWNLSLEQEFVYVGDAGIVEPSGRTKRTGIDFGLNYQLTNNFFLYGNVNYADPRAIDEPEDANYIPLAPTFTSIGGLSYQGKKLNGSIRYRYVEDRAANEDYSTTAEGYFVTDLNINYNLQDLTIGVSVENLFDVDWREAQFDTESRLANESESVSEIHFTPGVPFFLKAGLTYKF